MTIMLDRRRYYRNTLRQRVMATHRQLDRHFQVMQDHLVIRIRCNELVCRTLTLIHVCKNIINQIYFVCLQQMDRYFKKVKFGTLLYNLLVD